MFPIEHESSSSSRDAGKPVDSIRLVPSYVKISNLTHFPGCKVKRNYGWIGVHLVRETFDLREMGGIGSFLHNLFSESQALMRAKVRSIGGNAVMSFRVEELEMSDNALRNQVLVSPLLSCVFFTFLFLDFASGSRVPFPPPPWWWMVACSFVGVYTSVPPFWCVCREGAGGCACC